MSRNKVTYRIEKNHAFVHNFKVVGHKVEIIIKFLDKFWHFWRLDLDDERVGQFDMLSWDHQIIRLRYEHLNHVYTVA